MQSELEIKQFAALTSETSFCETITPSSQGNTLTNAHTVYKSSYMAASFTGL